MSDSPLPEALPLSDIGEAEATEGPEILGSHVCDTCMGDNLLKASGIRQCARCLNPFCIHYACKADPLTYCVSCMSELELTRSVYTKTYEHHQFNDEGDIVSTTKYTRHAREIKMSGEDWLFAQRRINTLSDAELDMVIEYHRQYLGLLLAEQDKKRMEKMHRNAGIRVVIPTGAASISSTTETTTRKVSTVKTDKAKEKAQALIAQLLGSGTTLEQLQAKLFGGKK